MLRVGVAGAHGKLGRVACAAIEAADDCTLAATLARGGNLSSFLATGLDVVLDATIYPATVTIARAAIDARIPIVIGATGWSDADITTLRDACYTAGVPAMLVPNFSFGAVLMMRFAAAGGARVWACRNHRDASRDQTRRAERNGEAHRAAHRRNRRCGAAPSTAVRLPGFVAHQEVIFGGAGETLTLRHDSLARDSFARGMLASVRAVGSMRGLTIGMDALVDDVVSDS